MKRLLAAAVLIAPLFVAGQALAHSKDYCKKHAEAYADQNSHPVGSAAVGGVLGAVGGAVVGGVLGGSKGAGTGALIGGAGGAVVGTVRGSKLWKDNYNKYYTKCLKQ